MDVFKIKYLFELFPGVDFEDEFDCIQNVVYNGTEYETVATPEKWALCYDNVKQNRNIQTKKKEKYSVKFILGRNIDISEAAVGYTTLTTTSGETFTIRDVEITKEKNEGTLNWTVSMVFWRYTDEIINHLSSDNVLDYKTGMSAAVNELSFTVKKPMFTFNDITTYQGAFPTAIMAFKVALTDLTNKIAENDYFYLHTDNITFEDKKNVAGQYMNYCMCFHKDANYVYFDCSHGEAVTGGYIYVLDHVLIDHEPDWRGTSASVVQKDYDFIIYTFINPILSEVETQEVGISKEDGITENQKLNYKEKSKLKFWLKNTELYLRKYLQMSLAEDTLLTTYTSVLYSPIQMAGLTKPVENDKLIDLYEFDLEILYSNLTINCFR
jgi:hypothetical protein